MRFVLVDSRERESCLRLDCAYAQNLEDEERHLRKSWETNEAQGNGALAVNQDE